LHAVLRDFSASEWQQAPNGFERPLPPQQIVCLEESVTKARHIVVGKNVAIRELSERPEGAQFRFPEYEMLKRG
jgi:hypothetical protein